MLSPTDGRLGPDLTGREFDRLKVVRFSENRVRGGGYYWLCRCKCGREKSVRATLLLQGLTRSCGCRAAEIAGDRLRKHGKGRTPEAAIWRSMVARCHNRKVRSYRWYGAIGVKVCDRWRNSFEDFLSDVGPQPAPGYGIDRFPDNTGNYEPGNVRWATALENQRNRRNNVVLTFGGETRTLVEWAEITGKKYGTLWQRVANGWSPERVLS